MDSSLQVELCEVPSQSTDRARSLGALSTSIYKEKIMAIINAFVCGIREFRLSFTTRYDNLKLDWIYDCGREFAHIVTFRLYE